jgi:3-carboxy-cis,cis-muconate cycloisomerase
MFVPDAIRHAVSEQAWIAAMLEFESALAAAEADAGLMPPATAEAIAAACRPERFDSEAIARQGRATANPAAPLVEALTEAVEGDAAGHVHRGATSQDATDTAAALVARNALALIDRELAGVGTACAELAERHRATLMPARTLLQQALPTTFGLKAAGWLDAVLDARRLLQELPLAAELGGAGGTLASLGGDGLLVLDRLAERLDLPAPPLPWHAARLRVARLGSGLALAAGTLEKIARDVTLLAQTEVAEAVEPGPPGHGASSTLPQKRNPARSVLAIACARRVRGESAILLEAMAAEHERGTGGWQAEWQALSGALAHTGGAAAAMREVLSGLEVRPQRMRANLEVDGGLVMAEAVSTALSDRLGRHEAHRLVGTAARRADADGRSLRDELAGTPGLDDIDLDELLDPARYLGSADALIDRALARQAAAE